MRIRHIALLLAAVLLVTMLPVTAQATENVWKEFYVATNGSDENPGTKEAPFATIAKAQAAVREVSDSMQGDIVVNIGGGYYFLDRQLDFSVADSGKNGYEIIYRGEEGNMPIVSAGKKVTGFTPSAEYPGVYEVSVPDVERIANIYVNEERRYMAKASTTFTGVKKPDKYNTDEWYATHPNDVKNNYTYHDPETPYTYDGMYMSKSDIGFWENPEDILCVWAEAWKSQAVPMQSIEPNPDNPDEVIVRMKEGVWDMMIKANSSYEYHPRPERAFLVMNAMELLDTPGEFYYNRKTEKLYYMPTEGEDLATATVIVPVEERILWLNGNDVDDKVKNITFEGLKFAHAAWYGWQEGYLGEQGAMIRATQDAYNTVVWPISLGAWQVTPSALTVQMADNVNFYDNYFFGMGAAALDMPNGVENCEVIGNAFSDLGDAAFFLGSTQHNNSYNNIGDDGMSDAPPTDAGLVCLNNMYYHRLAASYNYSTSALRNVAGLNRDMNYYTYPNDPFITYVDEYHYKGLSKWYSDPKAPERGEKSWLRWDFLTEYTIEKITLAFDTDSVKPEERTGFEVLVSNDKDFADGTYEVVATQTTPAEEVMEYDVLTDKKYRYVMVRTIGATPLALTRMWAFTSDLEPYTKYQKCKNVKFENNYVERFGLDILRATGVMFIYVENCTLKNNEIADGSYSGVNVGWGWSQTAYGAKNNEYSYNYIHDVCKVMHDGGGIYSLGRHENSVMEGNFVDGTGIGLAAYYSDQGTSGVKYINNAAEGMGYIYNPYTPSVVENQYLQFHGSHTQHDARKAGTYDAWAKNVIEPATQYVAGQPTKEAYAIIERAGLQDEYEHIKEWVPKTQNNLPDTIQIFEEHMWENYYDKHKSSTVAEASYMINNGVFGSGLGMFPQESLYKLKAAYTAFSGTSEQALDKLIELDDAINEVKKSVRRYSLEDTITFMKKEISEAKTVDDKSADLRAADRAKTLGMYLESDVKDFKKQVDALEKKANVCKSEEDEYDVLIKAEKAYNDFTSKKLSADISYLYVDGASGIVIDKENAIITVKFPLDATMGDKNYELFPEGNAEIARAMPNKFNSNKEFTIPMYCKENKTYKYWKVIPVYDYGTDGIITKDSKWYTQTNLTDTIIKLADNTMLTANAYVYMTDTYSNDSQGATVTFNPMAKSEMSTYTFIIGANRYEGLDLKGTTATNDRYEIEFSKDKATLYSVVKGSKKVVATKDLIPNVNEKNTFGYRFEKINNSTQLIVELNGQGLFSEMLTANAKGGYFGILTDKTNIKIY